jgi:predicted HAD superfamily phosphohydrolase YqeG
MAEIKNIALDLSDIDNTLIEYASYADTLKAKKCISSII